MAFPLTLGSLPLFSDIVISTKITAVKCLSSLSLDDEEFCNLSVTATEVMSVDKVLEP